MSEYIDVYIDTTTKVPEDATEFDYELFERFMSGGPWVAHSKYMELKAENAKLRELVRGLHMAYVETLNKCESLNEGLIWECSGNVDADVAKSRANFKADRHRFDAALRELGVEVDE